MAEPPRMVPFDFRRFVVPQGRTIPPGPRISVPVSAHGCWVFDRDGQQLCNCLAPEVAARIAYIINEHADA